MNQVKYFARYFLLLLPVFYTPIISAVEVKYYQDGELHTYEAQMSYRGFDSYLFNPEATKKVHLSTLNWPPYISSGLCDKGWVFQLTVAMLISKGYQVEIQFLPWARAMRNVELGQSDILFPDYFIEPSAPSDNVKGKTRRDILALSRSFPGGMVGFIKRKHEETKYNGFLTSIINERIGVVRGYQNTPEFDAMMDKEMFSTIGAVDELQLVQLLTARRVNLIIADPKVVKFAIKISNMHYKKKSAILDSIEAILPPLQYNPLYFAVNKSVPEWQRIMSDINSALTTFENNGEMKRIIESSKESQNCYNSQPF